MLSSCMATWIMECGMALFWLLDEARSAIERSRGRHYRKRAIRYDKQRHRARHLVETPSTASRLS